MNLVERFGRKVHELLFQWIGCRGQRINAHVLFEVVEAGRAREIHPVAVRAVLKNEANMFPSSAICDVFAINGTC